MNQQTLVTHTEDVQSNLLSQILNADIEGSQRGQNLWMHVTGAISTIPDAKRDKHTADAWIPRNSNLIRHPLSEPGARGGGAMGEPTANLLASSGFLTPPSVHFFHHHSAVPMLDADKHKLVMHIGKKKIVFSLKQLQKMDKESTTATIASAGLRGAELNARNNSQASSPFGPCALATGIWTGVPLAKLLARCGVKSCADYDANIVFRGPEKQIGIDGGTPYESCMPLAEALDPKRNVIVTYEMNGKPLTPDLGAPLRVIVPGSVDERCVKWLSSIVIGRRGAARRRQNASFFEPLAEPSTFFYQQRTRLYAPTVRDASEAQGRRLDSIPVNSAILVPSHGEIVRVDPYKPSKIALRGWAYSGGGIAISGVEVSLDRGLTWRSADLDGYRSNASIPFFFHRPERSWCWVLWTLSMNSAVLMHHMLTDGEIWVRATDSNGACQPEEAPWNFLGLCNNGFYKVKATVEVVESPQTLFYEVKFTHPCARELDGKCTGWLDIGDKPALPGKALAARSYQSAIKTLKRRDDSAHEGANYVKVKSSSSSSSAVVEEKKKMAVVEDETTTAATEEGEVVAPSSAEDGSYYYGKQYTWDEIAEHNSEDDTWIVINDIVYEVTKYLEQHPGGAASITMNAGEDTTEDFTAVHSAKAWKDLEQFRIGIVAGSSESGGGGAKPPPPPTTTAAVLPPVTAETWPSPVSTPEGGDTPDNSLRGGNTAGALLKKSQSGLLSRVESFFKKSMLQVDSTRKTATAKAAELAAFQRMVSPFARFPSAQAAICLNPRKWVKVKLAEIHWISPDTVLVRFALTSPQHVLGLPTGQHFMIKGKDSEGKLVIRAYTPTSPNTDVGFVDLVIKVYFPCPEYPLGGKLSQFIGNLKIGDEIDIKGPIGEITYLGRGKFTIHKVGELHCKRITLIGAGTGITPLLQIAAACLRDPEDDTKLRLVFANRREEDILCRRIVDNMVKKYPKQFECHYVLSKPPNDWETSGKGSAGRVSLPILRQFGFPFEATDDASDPGAIGLTCGSDAFNEQAAFGNLLQMGYPRDRMFAF
ncbi:nitrate reductase [Pycnococcus provasolii]